MLLRIVGQLQWLNEPAQQRIRFDAEAHHRPGLESGVGDAPGPDMISIEIAGDGQRENDVFARHQFGKMRTEELSEEKECVRTCVSEWCPTRIQKQTEHKLMK